MPNQDIPSKDAGRTSDIPAGPQAILDALQAEIMQIAQMPDTVAGKSIEKARTSLDRFFEVLNDYYGQQHLQEMCSVATRMWLWTPPGYHPIEFLGGDGRWYVPSSIGPISPSLGGGYLYLLEISTIFRLAPGTGPTGVELRPLVDLIVRRVCAGYTIDPGFVYIYEGGITLRSRFNLYLVENCTIFSDKGDYGTGDDFETDDVDWYDVFLQTDLNPNYNPIGDFVMDLIEGDPTTKGTLKAITELIALGPSGALMWGLIDKDILEEIFKAPLRTTSDALKMADHFIVGTGGTMVHGAGSSISEKVKGSGDFNTLVMRVGGELSTKIRQYDGFVDPLTLQISGSGTDTWRINWGLTDIELGWPIGGTQGLDIQILRLAVNPATRTYEAKLKIIIYDDFGVGRADLYTPPLVAFWLLQHVKQFDEGLYKPFINQIEVEYAFQGEY